LNDQPPITKAGCPQEYEGRLTELDYLKRFIYEQKVDLSSKGYTAFLRKNKYQSARVSSGHCCAAGPLTDEELAVFAKIQSEWKRYLASRYGTFEP
jgi:hypothetical protein